VKRKGTLSGLRHSKKPEIGTRHRRLCSGTRQRSLLVRFSLLALKVERVGSGPLEPKPTKAPAHADQLAGSSVAALPDNGLGGTRCNVVGGRKWLIGCRRGMEVVNDHLLVGDSVVAPAHGESVPRQGPGRSPP
jgi:hypothetical protein